MSLEEELTQTRRELALARGELEMAEATYKELVGIFRSIDGPEECPHCHAWHVEAGHCSALPRCPDGRINN